MSSVFTPKSFVNLDGKDDYIALPPLNVDWSQGLTIEAWARFEKFNQYSRIVDLSNGEGNANIVLSNSQTGPHLHASVITGQGHTFLVKDNCLQAQVWTHLAMTIEPSGISKLYQDGKLVHTGSLRIPATVNRTQNFIGRSAWSSDGYFQGQLAELRIWKVARTEAELQRDMSKRLTGTETGLAAYFPLDDGEGTTARDLVPSGWHGTMHGATFVAPPAASPGQRAVMTFDGVDDVVKLGLRPELKLQRDFTLEAWINAASQRQWAGIVTRIFDTGGTYSGYGLTLDGQSGIFCGLRTVSGPRQDVYTSTGKDTLSLGKWHHVAATYDGKQLALYIDGELKKSMPCASDINYNPENPLHIGAFVDNNEFYPFQGKIAEVRIWKRARTQEELRATLDHALRGDETDLVGYWPLDEGLGEVAKDHGPNGMDGDIVGAIWTKESVPFGKSPREKQLEVLLARLTACEDRLATYEGNLAAFAVKPTTDETRLAAVDAKLAAVDAKLAADDGRLAAHDTKLAAHDAKLAVLEDRLAAQQLAGSGLAQQFADHARADALVEQKLVEEQKRGALLEQQLAELIQSQAKLETKLAELAEQVSSVVTRQSLASAAEASQQTSGESDQPKPVVFVPAKDFAGAGSGTVRESPSHSLLTVTYPTGYIEWKVNLPRTGKWHLHAHFASAEARPCTLTLNGTEQDQPILGENTGSFQRDGLKWFIYGPYDLSQGENLFRIDFSGNHPHLSEFGFSEASPAEREAPQVPAQLPVGTSKRLRRSIVWR